MHKFFAFSVAAFFYGTAVQGQTTVPMQEQMFCDYVGIFAAQIVRNKVRGLPFSRLDEFDYFDDKRSEFLSDTAKEIYLLDSEILRTKQDAISAEKLEDCRGVFGSD